MKHSGKLFALFIALTVGSNAALAQSGSGGSAGGKKPAAPPSPPPAAIMGVLEDAQRASQDAMAEAQTLYRKFSYDAMAAGMPNAGAATLVIPKDAVDAKANAEMEEDLKVMALIIEKATSRDEKGRRAMGIKIRNNVFSPASPRNLYIEGYGALFFLNVNYPLLPPPTAAPAAEEKDRTSSEWEAAREELHRPPGGEFDFKFRAPAPFADDAERYDSAKVDELKANLISALKNAAHIRGLKSDEAVTVVVMGRESKSPAIKGQGDDIDTRPDSERSGSRLIIRARKSDIESLQKGKTTEDDFRKKVIVIM